MSDPRTSREARAGRFPGPSLVPALNAIQQRHGWLPREELVALARDARRPLYELQGLISFYPHFRTSPPPKIEVAVCRDLPCWLAGAEEAFETLAAQDGVELRQVSCLGRCDCAPAAAVNERPVRISDVRPLVAQALAGSLDEAQATRHKRRWPTDPYETEEARYGLLRRALAGKLDPDAVVQTLKDSNLRGMGGAGFPTGLKWDLVRAEAAEPKYVVCNADESEPGTFKDRQILAELPHLVLEGMLLGMWVAGAREGWVFIRHEYGPERRVLEAELERLRELGLVGEERRVEVFVSPGGYILGEESALLECMEGHRGEPRNKPPFPASHGLFGKPTLMNSVETFADVPVIVEQGAEQWKAQGVRGYEGRKFVAVSGHVERPDVYCVPMGTTVRELIELAGGVTGGRVVGAVQPGGASSSFLGPEALDTPLDFKALQEAGSMLGSGAVVVMAEGTNLLAAATNVLRFFKNESCGKCVPCRVGSEKAHRILSRVLEAGGGCDDVDERILELEETMRLTSICGLGQVALGPVVSVLRLERGRARAST